MILEIEAIRKFSSATGHIAKVRFATVMGVVVTLEVIKTCEALIASRVSTMKGFLAGVGPMYKKKRYDEHLGLPITVKKHKS